MTDVIILPNARWDQQITTATQELVVDALERGSVLWLPQLSFRCKDDGDSCH
jgi:hypothetical protein